MNQIPQSLTQNIGRAEQIAIQPSQVQQWTSNLSETADQTSRLITELESRIHMVTRPEGPTANVTKDAPLESLVETAGSLREITQNLETSNNRLRSLLGRIEL